MFFILEERFQTIQHDFKEKYYHHFTDEEENKLIYMDIFKEYVSSSEISNSVQVSALVGKCCVPWQNSNYYSYSTSLHIVV